MRHTHTTLPLLALLIAGSAAATTNVLNPDKWSWGENTGWMNWRDAEGGAAGAFIAPGETHLGGWVWSENHGWITLGDGAGPYANATGADHGVNVLGSEFLDGYAWGENLGWINFGVEPFVGAAGARFDAANGRLRGYAWSENKGWINLDDGTFFVRFDNCPADLNGDGEVGAGDLGILIAAWGSNLNTSGADLDGSGTVGAGDLGILIAAWGSCG